MYADLAMNAPTHPREEIRLRALQAYPEVGPDPALQELVAYAAEVCEAPVSLVSMVEEDRQWFRARVGFARPETTREESFCAHAILQDGVFEVPDATQDVRFADNPLVTGDPHVRFYSGVPIRTSEGLPLGSFCVLDTKPRALTDFQRRTLELLARQAEARLDLLRKARELERERAAHLLADEKVEEGRDLLRLITDRLPVRVAYFDLDNRYQFVNDAYEKQLGLRKHEVLGRTVTEVVGSAVFEAGDEYMKRARRGETATGVLEIPYSSGTQWIQASYVPDIDAEGAVRGIIVQALDVTESRRAQEALLQSESRRRLALNSAGIGAWNIDLATQTLTTDEIFRRIFSGKTEPIEYEAAFEWIHPDDRQEVRDRVAAACLPVDRVPYALEYRTVHFDGSIHWVFGQGRANFREEGGVPVTFDGTVVDITERSEALLALRASEERFRAVLETTPDPFTILEAIRDEAGEIYDFRWTYANEATARLTGNTVEELLNSTVSKIRPAVMASDLFRTWLHTVETGEPFNREVAIDYPHGRSYLRLTGVRVGDGFATTVSDLTERHEIEARLQAAVDMRTADLQNAVKEAEAFNYAIAHDLRTPLRAIASTSGILLEEAFDRLTEAHQELLFRQGENVKRLSRLIDELLRLSRLARVEVKRERLDMGEKALFVFEELEADGRTGACDVEVQEGMFADGDPGLVHTVLQNLIGNACKFSTGGGTVRIGEKDGVFSVTDEGVGFNMAFAHKIFIPFERLVSDDEFEGTGIGLANVERIVRRHGGRVWVESEVGEGTTFFFTLS